MLHVGGMTNAHTERTRKTERLGTVLMRVAARLVAHQRNLEIPAAAHGGVCDDRDQPADGAGGSAVREETVPQAYEFTSAGYGVRPRDGRQLPRAQSVRPVFHLVASA